jgi:hypothetical protein
MVWAVNEQCVKRSSKLPSSTEKHIISLEQFGVWREYEPVELMYRRWVTCLRRSSTTASRKLSNTDGARGDQIFSLLRRTIYLQHHHLRSFIGNSDCLELLTATATAKSQRYLPGSEIFRGYHLATKRSKILQAKNADWLLDEKQTDFLPASALIWTGIQRTKNFQSKLRRFLLSSTFQPFSYLPQWKKLDCFCTPTPRQAWVPTFAS